MTAAVEGVSDFMARYPSTLPRSPHRAAADLSRRRERCSTLLFRSPLLRRGLLFRRRLLRLRSRSGRRGRVSRTDRPRSRLRALGRRGLATPARALGRRRGDQRLALLERERFRVAVLRDLAVLRTVGDVRPVAPVQNLDPGLGECPDDAIRLDLAFLADDRECALERDGVRIVLLLQGRILLR